SYFSMKEEVLRAREVAIREALKEIRDGMVIGYGSGTTVAQMTGILRGLICERGLNVVFIPSSLQSADLILSHGLKLASLAEYPEPDLMLDSFDQVDAEGNVIKGGGGALLREKVLMQASKRVVLVGDNLKLKEKMDFPVPIEILQYAYPHVKRVLSSWGLKMEARVSGGKMGPVITDNGNILADVHAGVIDDPEALNERLRSVAGILETGICPKAADMIIIGYPNDEIKCMNINRKKF
ncbi:MAG: ribose 5-phosphate isomerase A, partial [Candidatus Verstraetearchaeota archaeon]|nr:ribose 5-phosphate isomerase A [Candidatus Verstraetearchaeota archaeon]